MAPFLCRFRPLTRATRAAALAGALLAGSALARADELPADVDAAIRKDFVSPDAETRYLDGSIDLDGDGKPEILVYVVGPMACGTGGCPTLVFTPAGSGYRRVSTISVTRPPISAATATSHGWRNLIVHVGGGGGKSRDVELLFDGKSYPGNPTVAGPRVKPAPGGGDVVIRPFDDFSQARPLPAAPAKAAPAGKPAANGPSFDCAKASQPAEKTICADVGLSALDRELAGVYAKAMADWDPDTKKQQRADQVRWLSARNQCAGADAKACLETRYRRRLVELRIKSGALEAPSAVGFACQGHERSSFFAAFYGGTDPRAVVLTWDDRQVVAFAVETGSGTRYEADGVEYREHQGEAAVKWGGESFICRPLKSPDRD